MCKCIFGSQSEEDVVVRLDGCKINEITQPKGCGY